MFRGLMLYVFMLQSEFVFKQKFKFWNPLNVFVSLIGLLLNKSCKNPVFLFSRKCSLRTSIQTMLLVLMLLNVYITPSISQIRIAECHPLSFPFYHAKWQFLDTTQWITKLQKLENKMFPAIILNTL